MLSTSETTFCILNKSFTYFYISIYILFPPPVISTSVSVCESLKFLSGLSEKLTCFHLPGKQVSNTFFYGPTLVTT